MRVLICAASLLCLTAGSTITAQNRQLDFELLNRTGLIIAELYVSPTSDDEWGEDVLGRDILRHGETVEIQFSRKERECFWDMRIVDEDDDEVVWEKLNLCEASHITLRYENGQPTATIK